MRQNHMKRVLLILSLSTGISYGQFCPNLGPDQILPCGVSSTTLTANFSQCGPGQSPSQTTAYTVQNIPYVAQTNTGTQLFMSDDSQQGPFNIGFNFCYFGQTYTQFYIGSNGWISFSGGQPTTFASVSIPSAAGNVPKNCIMGPWQDWHPGVGGQIRYQVQGVAPCRKLVVSWIGVPMFSCTNLQGTFHIVIYESTNLIENHIQSKPNCPAWAGGTAVQGIHNLAGSAAVTVAGRNSTQWTTNNNAVRYTPSGPPVVATPTWFQVGNPAPIGTGTTITVAPPPAGANYICIPVYPLCNAGWSQCNNIGGLPPDTVFVQPGPASLPTPGVSSIDPICNNACEGSISVTPVGGTGAITISWGAQGNTFSIANLCPGSYTFNLADAAGCTYDSTIVINNPPALLPPTLSGTDPTCFGFCDGEADVTPNNGVAPYTFQWSDGQLTQVATGLCDGNYSVTVFDANNCPAQGSININEPAEITVNQIVGSDTVCFGSTTNGYSISSSFSNLTYDWTATAGQITQGQGTSSINLNVASESGGTYNNALSVIGVDANGCESQAANFNLVVLQLFPSINVNGPLCEYDNCVPIITSPVGGIISGSGVTNGQFCPDASLVGDNTLNYVYEQSNCTFDANTTVTVFPRPVVNYIYNNLGANNSQFSEVCEGTELVSTYNASTTGGLITWYFSGDTIQSQELSLIWSSAGGFVLAATVSENGCISLPVDYDITIQDCPQELIFIPNAFTPDNDENNQQWIPIFTDGFDPYDFDLLIYNRWGELIWESKDPSIGWDGTYNGIICPEGIYTWKVSYGVPETGKKSVKQGHLTLFR
jgi:gliding motility-associated-like protein